ncbi:hypothetical protein [Burkholderia pseudomultivorans]|uniref:Uncharacterized protein n=1 Tax=Burkholderia pseudomultivorans TaxID=1207504 RepID=A0ABU2ED35_9BURK|nr:hypothetical protein [Burkholderia pseudomultivorans]MDR8731343.1 hypothetical protein [Burkholderia pseudomultivorans]MDR8738964.1 hypothetical protein [Burkholderia pseudomultivorans]MDR8745515.1 hypothetical protein [Burkholderia pseudomultivorans]MDR8757783.1 hypothetical protein [Burkholderia pseudomultivorans]MDR8781883.1 hypothetical protein [Burkholderia pseudomultivorans]
MQAIFTGSLLHGFDLSRIVLDGEAAAVLETIDAPHAEALGIEKPSDHCGTFDGNPDGRVVVMFCDGVAGGATVYGPWLDRDDAEAWAEDVRRPDQPWQVLECPS